MKKILFAISLLLVSSLALSAATNFGKMNVTSIESRDTGYHEVYFSVAVPEQGCVHNNRALLNEESTGGKAMLSILLSSLVSGKEVVVRVDGCFDNRPNITKVQIYQ